MGRPISTIKKKTKEEMAHLRLSSKEYFFVRLFIGGCDARDAWFFCMGNEGVNWKPDYLQSQIDAVLQKDGAKELMKKFEPQYEVEKTERVDYTDKNVMIEELAKQAQLCHEPDKKAKILMSIADLQQMKKDDNVEEEERVHFHLPMKCGMCPLKQKHDADNGR
ncbi:MAG: hypothetical protein K5854_01535 [Prevotella sp.]|nr:hypothetical protein [Prevotella sp.]